MAGHADTGGSGESGPSPQSGSSPLGSIQNLIGPLTRIFPQLGQAVSLFKPLMSSIWSLVQAAMPSAVGGGVGAVAGAVGAGGGVAGALGGAAGGAAAAGVGAGIAALGSNPVGWAIALVGAAALVTAAFVALPSATTKFVDSLIEGNRALAEVSGSMAAVLAMNDVNNIRRDMRRGDMLSPSVKDLASANARLKDSTLALETGFGTLTNKLSESVARIVNIPFETKAGKFGVAALSTGMVAAGLALDNLVTIGSTAAGLLLGIKNNTEKEDDGLLATAEMLNRITAEAKDARERNDPRFRRVDLR
jgi:hypothetical protein